MTYRRRRAADRTPEPVPPPGPLPAGNDDTFVIQEHHARRLHWDFRLERAGVLVSWALPRGVPADPRTNHLAVHTEDHPLEYAEFAGEIPRGEYGGGRVHLWDRGTYETEKWSDREVKIVLRGRRVSGRYVLFQTHGKNWMIHRMDPPADPGAVPLPGSMAPMRARERARIPRDPDRYAFEFAWPGVRVLAFAEYGRVLLRDADGRDVTARYAPVRPLGAALGSRQVLLDGTITELTGRATYLIFDLLHLDGRSLLAEAYVERRRRLDTLALAGAGWQTAPWFERDGRAVLAAARQRGLPGIVAKRLAAPYEPGRLSDDWRLIAASKSCG